jgi:hypothetical protein
MLGHDFEYAAQYEFPAKQTTLLEAGDTVRDPAPPYRAAVGSTEDTEEFAGFGSAPPATERHLSNKAAKRQKLTRQTNQASEIVTSVREFSKKLSECDERNSRLAEEKLKLAKQSDMLKLSHTLFVHESSTAFRAENFLAACREGAS